jgi:uncharacterized protein YjbJ (UPF0337 family)
MNKDVFEHNSEQIEGEPKVWLGKLTYDDLDLVSGKFDALPALLQQKYGYSRHQAAREIDKLITDYETGLKKKDPVPTRPNKRNGD